MDDKHEKNERERLIEDVRKKRDRVLAVLPPSEPVQRVGDGETLEQVIESIRPHIREREPDKPRPWTYARSMQHARGIPPRIAEMLQAGTTDNTPAVKGLASCLRDGSHTVVMWGGTGRGKSVAAARYVMAPYEYGPGTLDRGPLFCTTRDYLRALRNNGPVLDWLWTPDRVELSDRLALDDAGSELADAKGWGPGEIAAMLNSRHERRLVTVITTNMTPEDFRDRYGDRLMSRLQDGGVWLECDGPDLRG